MATVFLLYEGDEYLSAQSIVLMGVFSSKESLKKDAKKLIWQRRKEHLQNEKNNCLKGEHIRGTRELCADILAELLHRGSTCSLAINYSFTGVELDKLGEI